MLASTRFNKDTYKENLDYRNSSDLIFYGTNMPMNIKLPFNIYLPTIEMLNDENKIAGISIVYNQLVSKRHKIYKNNGLNLFLYFAKYFIPREEIIEFNKDLVELLELLLFKGKTHMKRLSGITILKEKLLTDKRNTKNINIIDEIFKLYKVKYNLIFITDDFNIVKINRKK